MKLPSAARLADRVWFGRGVWLSASRAALWPLAIAYGVVVRVRGRLYDARVLRTGAAVLPALSVGNLTVGGTGKTPLSAWLAGQLANRARPAIVMRGYAGGDEVAVHRRLNPGVPVIADPDRRAGIASARRAGADVVVLDDAFQHRRVARLADLVVISAEQLARPARLLPAGPWREPLAAARRADLVVVTHRVAPGDAVRRATEQVRRVVGGIPVAVIRLAPGMLVDATNDSNRRALSDLSGAHVQAIAAIGEPEAFRLQLEELGATVSLSAFDDHHEFTEAEAASLASRVPAGSLAVCTLKDAVKLGPLWPGAGRLWYVSQQLSVEQGRDDIERLLQRVLDARTSTSTAAG